MNRPILSRTIERFDARVTRLVVPNSHASVVAVDPLPSQGFPAGGGFDGYA